MISCERRYLSLFFSNTMNSVNDGVVFVKFALPQEFCAANKSKRKIGILNYQYWTLKDDATTSLIDYESTNGIHLCADFNQSDPANDNFIMLSNNDGSYHESNEFDYVINNTSIITVIFKDLLANDLPFHTLQYQVHNSLILSLLLK